MNNNIIDQNELLLSKIMKFYNKNNNFNKMLKIINGESNISLRIIDWFTTNYAKKYFTIYSTKRDKRFKVYDNYKLKLKAYKKSRFDPFCRWDRITIPYNDDSCMETTIGQLNFFKWAIENKIIEYIENNYDDIEKDMNERNSISKKKKDDSELTKSNITISADVNKTRKKREELSVSACKCIKKEKVKIVVKFDL